MNKLCQFATFIPDAPKIFKRILISVVTVGLAITAPASIAYNYQVDNGYVYSAFNASDDYEPRDNWVGNVFTAQTGANLITQVDLGYYDLYPYPEQASVALYEVTDPGGNPALGANLVYSQNFSITTGNTDSFHLWHISLSAPVLFDVNDIFLVSVFIPDVEGYGFYPFLLDTSNDPTGSYWGRSNASGDFDINDLSGVGPIGQPLDTGLWYPPSGHVIIRAVGTTPEPATIALMGLGLAGMIYMHRRKSSQA